jgi:uncharacterized protein (TIGR03089 family)
VSVTETLLGTVLRQDPARPVITFYDDRDGTRVELSRATLANWAAKTANWLRDECGLELGDPVHIDLPAHWQTAGALLGAWWCGAHVVDHAEGAAVSLVAPDRLANADGGGDVRAVVALDPLGRGLAAPPDGWLDWATEIRVHGDYYTGDAVPGDTPALLGASVNNVLKATATRAADLGITPGARVLSTVDWTLPDGLIDGFLAVLHAHASLVHCANPDPTRLDARASTEHVTVSLGG